jgi:Zn-dependent metalloprotease
MKTKFFYLSLICILTSQQVFSQNFLHDSTNTTIYLKTWENDTLGLLWWKTDSMQAGQLFTTYKSFTGLAENDSMHITNEWNDSFVCLHHRRYQQYHNGIRVQGAEYREHFTDDYVVLSNGHIAETLSLSADTPVSEEGALNYALNHIGAITYAWEDDSLEYYLREDSIPEKTTFYPKGELIYALLGDKTIKEENYKLAWKFTIWAIDPYYAKTVYVDASNGEILREVNSSKEGVFTHIFYGSQYLDTRWYGGLKNKYFLIANDGTKNIKTKDDKFQNQKWNFKDLPDDQDDVWSTDHKAATSAHYVIQTAWDMFSNLAGRNGLDNTGKEIRIMANDPDEPQSAEFRDYWSSSKYDYFIFADGSYNSLLYYPATYDIGGHEFAHGITLYTSGLDYEGESGALDESFSDICGFMTERFAQPSTWDWMIGEDFLNPQPRNMQLPSNQINTFA